MLRKLKLAAILGTSLVLIVNTTGCSLSGNTANKAIPTLVSPIAEQLQTVKAVKGTIERKGTVNGKIVSTTNVQLVFKNKTGYLGKLNVKAGDTVKKGQVVAELDTEDMKYDLKQAQLDYELDKYSYDTSPSEPAKIRLEKTKLKIEQIQENLKGNTLTAPITGIVISVTDSTIGSRISNDAPIAVIADPSSIQVQCDGKLTDYKLGSKVSIKVGKEIHNGEIVSNTTLQTDTSSPSRIYVKFTDNTNGIKLGDFADVTCVFQKKDDVLTLPIKAIKTGEGNYPYVRIKSKDDVEERYIEIGIQDNTTCEIVSGVSEDEEVIIN